MSTILIVDDAETMRNMISQVLESEDYEVISGIDGEDGLTKFKSNTVDLVITDINMPIKDGLTLIKDIRAVDEDVPILTLTTESEESMRQKGAEAGANGWIVKPLRPAQFLDIIKQVLD